MDASRTPPLAQNLNLLLRPLESQSGLERHSAPSMYLFDEQLQSPHLYRVIWLARATLR
jgi:hypothetical protein